MKVIVAPVSFKGTLSAPDAACAMTAGVRRAWPDAEVVEAPLADGGEGTAEALVAATRGRLVSCRVTGPLADPITASFGLLGPDETTAIVEMAQAAGLGLVPEERRDPRRTTTYGVGELLRSAVRTGARRIIVGLGGSATNDGGTGAMAALGVRFLDADEQPLPPGGAGLARLAHIDLSGFDFPTGRISVLAASDVRNPLTGPNGSSAVYGPQKGADAAMVAELDAALAHYGAILHRELGRDVARLPGAGAAGGLGAALAAFLNAEFRPGIDVVLDAVNFEAQAHDADWVLTGEGRLDRQTLSGKAISGLLARCRTLDLPILAFGGSVEAEAVHALQQQGLTQAISLVADSVTVEMSLQNPVGVLSDAVTRTLAGLRNTV